MSWKYLIVKANCLSEPRDEPRPGIDESVQLYRGFAGAGEIAAKPAQHAAGADYYAAGPSREPTNGQHHAAGPAGRGPIQSRTRPWSFRRCRSKYSRP